MRYDDHDNPVYTDEEWDQHCERLEALRQAKVDADHDGGDDEPITE